jgi:S1-C subfamily serine protease
MHALVFAILLKAATVIVTGHAGMAAPQDVVWVGVGSGVVVGRIDAEHYAVVTAAHVARYGHPRVTLFGHGHERPQVQLTFADRNGDDLAMLVVRSRVPLPVAPLALRDPSAGARLQVVGHPYARTWTVTRATYAPAQVLSKALRPLVTVDTTRWICRGCDRGNSGSGIYDPQGRLAGVIYAAAPLPAYRMADERELRSDEYNPNIVRQVLAVDVREVRTLLSDALRAWREQRRAAGAHP